MLNLAMELENTVHDLYLFFHSFNYNNKNAMSFWKTLAGHEKAHSMMWKMAIIEVENRSLDIDFNVDKELINELRNSIEFIRNRVNTKRDWNMEEALLTMVEIETSEINRLLNMVYPSIIKKLPPDIKNKLSLNPLKLHLEYMISGIQGFDLDKEFVSRLMLKLKSTTDSLTLSKAYEHKAEILSRLIDVGIALSYIRRLDVLLDYILQRVTDVMDADRSTLYLVDSEKGELVSKIAQDMPGKKEIRLKIGQGIAGYTAETGKLVNIHDARNDPRFDNTFDAITGYTTRNMLCSPLINNMGRTIGIIQVINKKDGTFEKEDEDILTAFSSQAAVAIENARLQENLRKKMDELEMLHSMEIKISSLFELDDILHTLLEDSMNTMEVESGSVILIDRNNGEFYFKVALGPKGADIGKIRFPLSVGIAGWSALNKKALYVNDVLHDERFYAKISAEIDYPTRNILCVPIFFKDEIVGVMQFINKTGRNTFFNDDDLKLAAIIASQAAKAIERANLFEKLLKTEKLSAIGSMASSIVHDLKTPISAIKNFTHLLIDERISAEKKRGFSEIINNEIDRFVRMTEELLEFSKGKKIKMNIKECNIRQFIDYLSPFIERDFEGRNIEFVKTLDYDGTIKMDSEKMMRVILNLSGNAGDAMPKGGKFTIKSAKKNSMVEFTISDTGKGIPDEIKDRLFEPFATSGKMKGTGLGLAIAKKIVEEHHGKIKVESKKGEGTTFYISIPD